MSSQVVSFPDIYQQNPRMHLSSPTHVGNSMLSEPNFQHSDPRMKHSICEAKIMNSFGGFFKILKG
jgi:hypothetical protein